MKFGFGFGFGSAGSATFAPVAPVLARTTADSDNTPDFSLLATNPQAGDTFELQISDNIAFTGTPDTIDVGFVSSNPVVIATSTVLANAIWYAQAKMTHSGVDSAWSNVVTFTITAAIGQPIGLLLALTKAA